MVQHSYLMSKGMNRITHSKERITPAVVKSTRRHCGTLNGTFAIIPYLEI
jgi:hypothetical protein